jgi:hypothetical protein
MSTALAKAFLKAKMDFDHSVCEAIKVAATKFHEQTGVKPSTIKFEMEYDCTERDGRLEYTLKHAGFDYNLDEVA